MRKPLVGSLVLMTSCAHTLSFSLTGPGISWYHCISCSNTKFLIFSLERLSSFARKSVGKMSVTACVTYAGTQMLFRVLPSVFPYGFSSKRETARSLRSIAMHCMFTLYWFMTSLRGQNSQGRVYKTRFDVGNCWFSSRIWIIHD